VHSHAGLYEPSDLIGNHRAAEALQLELREQLTHVTTTATSQAKKITQYHQPNTVVARRRAQLTAVDTWSSVRERRVA